MRRRYHIRSCHIRRRRICRCRIRRRGWEGRPHGGHNGDSRELVLGSSGRLAWSRTRPAARRRRERAWGWPVLEARAWRPGRWVGGTARRGAICPLLAKGRRGRREEELTARASSGAARRARSGGWRPDPGRRGPYGGRRPGCPLRGEVDDGGAGGGPGPGRQGRRRLAAGHAGDRRWRPCAGRWTMGAVAEGRIRGDEVGGGQRHPWRGDGDDAGGSGGAEPGRRGRRQGAVTTDGGALGSGRSRTMGSSALPCVRVWCGGWGGDDGVGACIVRTCVWCVCVCVWIGLGLGLGGEKKGKESTPCHRSVASCCWPIMRRRAVLQAKLLVACVLVSTLLVFLNLWTCKFLNLDDLLVACSLYHTLLVWSY